MLGVHHTGKDGKTFRGSSVFEAGADTVYCLTMDGSEITLDREKRKDGPKNDTHQLALDVIPGTDSCTVKSSHGPQNGVGTLPDTTAKMRKIFQTIFPATGASRSIAVKVAAEQGIPSSSAYRALSDLLSSGFLVNDGSDTRPFYKIADPK